MIAFESVSKSFDGERLAVRELTLRVEHGETLVLLGSSGSGKTTVLKMVNGLVAPSAGRVLVDESDVTRLDPVGLRRRFGYVFQGIGLFPHLTVEENVSIVARLDGASIDERRRLASEMLELVGCRWASTATGSPRSSPGDSSSGWALRAPSPPARIIF